MKLVALWLAVVVIAAAAAGSCSVSHRSGDFACENANDCRDDRICSDGFCVLRRPVDAGVDPRPDAPPPPPIDAGPVCPAQCTSCDVDTKSCIVNCAVDDELCTRRITCPAGWSCDIACSRRGSCNSTVDCTDATACTISCSAAQTCANVTCGDTACKLDCTGTDSCLNVDCGSGTCDVRCEGFRACDAVNCGKACACDVACGLDANCIDVTCPSIICEDGDFGCTSQVLTCNTCP